MYVKNSYTCLKVRLSLCPFLSFHRLDSLDTPIVADRLDPIERLYVKYRYVYTLIYVKVKKFSFKELDHNRVFFSSFRLRSDTTVDSIRPDPS